MRVAKVEDILCIVGFAVALVLACGISFVTLKILDDDEYNPLEGVGVTVSIILWIAVICLFIASLFCIDDLIQIHYNPNYWILQHIISAVTSHQ